MGWVQIAGVALALVTLLLLVIRPLWGLFALIIFFPFAAVVPRLIEVTGFNWATVLFIVGFLSMVVRQGLVLPPLRLLLPIAAFYLVMIVALILTVATWDPRVFYPVTKVTMIMRLKMMLWPTLIFFLAYGLANTPARRFRVMTAVVASALIAALAPLVGIEIESPIQQILGTTDARAAGLLQNPNHLGMILSFISVIPLIRFFDRETPVRSKPVYVAIYALYVVSLTLSLSRRAWVGVLASHLTFLWHVKRILLIPALVGFVVLVTLGYALLPEVVRARIEYTFTPGTTIYAGAEGLESSAGSRVALYRIGFDMFLDSPLIGQGFEGFVFKSRHFGAKYGILTRIGPHSVPMKAISETGLLGSAILVWVFGTAVFTARAVMRREDSDRDVGVYFSCVLASVLVASFFGNVLNHSYVTFFFWSAFGLAARARFQVPEQTEATEPAPMGLVPALIATREAALSPSR